MRIAGAISCLALLSISIAAGGVESYSGRVLLSPFEGETASTASAGGQKPHACLESTRQVFLMGTQVSMTSCAANRELGLAELEDYIRILESTETELSTWQRESTISRLNQHPVGAPFALTPQLTRMFEELYNWHHRTNGTFDPGIGALTEVWGIHGSGRIPKRAELQSAVQRSGLKYFSFDRTGGHITRLRDASIDVGAFGKGEALDRIYRYAKDHQTAPFLIDLGGQILAAGAPSGKSGWEVDLASPTQRHSSTLALTLTTGSLSTSAGSERDVFFEGRRIGHHIDPRTGEPVTSSGSVTVWHPNALIADMLSTALFVMGPHEGIRWADENGIAALFQTPNFRSSKAWREEFL